MIAAWETSGGWVLFALMLIVLGIWVLLGAAAEPRGSRIARRMTGLAVAGDATAATGVETVRSAAAVMPRWVGALFGQANLHPTRGQMLAVLLADAAVAAGAGWAAGAFFALLSGAAVAGVELAVLRSIANRRLARFTADLPVFLDKIVQLVKVGNSLRQALERASEASPPVVKAYLAPVLRRIENGAAVEDALRWLALRLDLIEFHMLVLTLEANLLYGGRLSNTIGFLVQILRDKQRVDRELRASTSEGRATAWVIGALPPMVAAFEWFRFPDFLFYFLKTGEGHLMLSAAIALEGVGVLLLNRILKLAY